jgi:hypothetical protein
MYENENKKFSNTQWLSNCLPAEKAFHGLYAITHNLLRPGDKVTLPSIAHPYAWRSMWSVYQELLGREKRTASAASTPVDSGRQRETDAMRNQFAQVRQRFIDLKSAGTISDTAAEFLGIRDGDLDSPVVQHEKFGNILHSDWMGRSERIGNALSRWERMSANERAEIRQRLQARNLAKRIVRLEQAAEEKEKVE